MENTLTPNYVMELEDYLDILHRRKFAFLVTFIAIFLSGIIIAFVLPPVYRSEATIIIERQEIPTDLVATTVTGYVQERIEGIRQRLVTYNNLVDIEEELNIYPDMRKAGDVSEMVALIKKSIRVEMVDIKATNIRGGQSIATIAFTVGYEADSAEVAQKVAGALANRYLEENKQARSEQAAEVSAFLDIEAERLRTEIVELEKSLASFKQEKLSELPELMDVNMRLYEKTEGQIEATRDRISKLEDARSALESELSLTNPRKAVLTEEGKIIQSPSDRLSVLISEFLQTSARYSPSHPDIVRLRREIKILGGQSNAATEANRLVAKITRLRSKLLETKQKYAEDHPDVLSLERSIAAVERGLRDVEISGTDDRKKYNVPADNPRYVALKNQLDAATSNLKLEHAKLRQYNKKLTEYEKRLFQTPVVERDYKSLSRDYANAQKKYAELRDKQIQARLAEQVEAGDQAERFVLAGRAYLPTSPDSPNRLGIILLAGLLAFSGGVGNIAMAEYKDRSVRGARGVVKLFGALPIAVIPYIENAADRSNKIKRRLRKLAVLLFIIIIVMSGVHIFLKPLDELWMGPQSEVTVPVKAAKQNEN